MSGTRLPKRDKVEMNNELDPTRRLHMLLNCKNEMRVGIYNVSPAMVSLFLKHGDLGDIIELDDVSAQGSSKDFVVRMAEIAKCKDTPGMWRKVEHGSFDSLRFCEKWLGYADDLKYIDGGAVCSIKPENRAKRKPLPGRKVWDEIVKGNMLIPRWDDERQTWKDRISDSVDPATYKIPEGKLLRLPDGKVLRPPRSPPSRSRHSDPSKYKKPPPPQSSYDEFPPASSSRPRPARSPPSRPHHSGPRKYEQPSPRYSSYDKYTPASSSRSGGKYRDYR
ncbi:MAG: hypothetical protein OHK93_004596 [Ramalina farinacea]|uniref:Uncharacterized protein n=1 Tax=Ramalina farinacea TaxID=258253 RepID=A0AA43TYM2_9LECA|nr:hypothetical protein [Ramalina farinacea]